MDAHGQQFGTFGRQHNGNNNNNNNNNNNPNATSAPTDQDQVRTLFVSGLPMDAKPRELYLLFRAYKVSFASNQVLASPKRRPLTPPALIIRPKSNGACDDTQSRLVVSGPRTKRPN